jgi:PAS domain-containing protein
MSLITDTPINCLSTVFATLPVAAVIVRDADGHPQIDRANEAFCELFGIDERPEELVGRRWLERWRPSTNGACSTTGPCSSPTRRGRGATR